MDVSATRVQPASALVADFGADYADAFRAAATGRGSARAWAERSLAGAEAADGAFARLVWHGLLRFDLAPLGTDGTLVGWQVGVDEPDRFVMDVDGPLMTGRMVFETTAASVTWTTMLRYRRAAARRVWAVSGHAHRALTPRCLEAARRSLAVG